MKNKDSYMDIVRALCEYKGYKFIEGVELEGVGEYFEPHYFFVFEKNKEIHVIEHLFGPFNPLQDISLDYVTGEEIPLEDYELLFKKIFSSERTLTNFMKIKFIHPLGAYEEFKRFVLASSWV